MELAAAIDLLDGRARRLVRGDYARPIEASADAVELAREWLAAGVRRLHVVDLDGARLGRPANLGLVARVCEVAAQAGADTRVEVGGGLRDGTAVESTFDAGADEVILGSAALLQPGFLAACAVRWPGRVGASLDLRDGRPAVRGWRDEISADAFEVAVRLVAEGASRLVVTDIARDGTGDGPNLDLLADFRQRFPTAVLVAAGGVGLPADLAALADLGLDGAIVGRALLDGSLDVREALAAVRGTVRR